MIKRQIEQLMSQVRELESHVPDRERSNIKVSAQSVGWHIEHSLLVLEQIINSLKRSNPGVYRRKLHVIRELVFMMNTIPRGKGKAPKSTVPKGSRSEEELNQLLKNAPAKILELLEVPHSHFFSHPFFGDLKYERTVKFLNMHTRHHLKIIKDILKRS